MKLTIFVVLLTIVATSHSSVAAIDLDSCSDWYSWTTNRPTSSAEYSQQRDTLKRYIESCAMEDRSYHALPIITSAVLNSDLADTTRFDHYREWLLSVLYLNTVNPYYYCGVVAEFTATYEHGAYSNIPNSALAVLYYMKEHAPCGGKGVDDEIHLAEMSRHTTWLQGDTTKPEDTTLPPLDSIGLGALLHPPSAVPLPGTDAQVYLASFTGSPNPFTKETEFTYVLNRMTYVTVAIYDELGRMVWGDGKGRSLDTGVHTIRIDGTGLPSGTLYARISTGFGEVKTVKLVHQE